jgi:hypothetical protein
MTGIRTLHLLHSLADNSPAYITASPPFFVGLRHLINFQGFHYPPVRRCHAERNKCFQLAAQTTIV